VVAKKLGIPVAMVNKVGRSYKPPPNEINGFFPGLSAIVDSDGTVRLSMDDKEGIGFADVTLDPSGKKTASDAPVCTGVGIAELTIGGRRAERKSRSPRLLAKSLTTPILYAKRRRLRFQGSPEFFRCAPPWTIARPRTDFSRVTGQPEVELPHAF